MSHWPSMAAIAGALGILGALYPLYSGYESQKEAQAANHSAYVAASAVTREQIVDLRRNVDWLMQQPCKQ
ncbi:MAG: hypothetical protein WBR15_02740 [Gammaproteobacteria bacterium]